MTNRVKVDTSNSVSESREAIGPRVLPSVIQGQPAAFLRADGLRIALETASEEESSEVDSAFINLALPFGRSGLFFGLSVENIDTLISQLKVAREKLIEVLKTKQHPLAPNAKDYEVDVEELLK